MSPALQLGTDDFTIAWWQYETAGQSFPRTFSIGTYPTAQLAFDKEGTSVYFWRPGATVVTSQTSEQRYGVWTHYAICRESGHATIYQDGSSIWSSSLSTNYNFSYPLYIGSENNSDGAAFLGYIYGFTWLVGVALYTADFTPSVDAPEAAYALNLTGDNQYVADGITIDIGGSVGYDGPVPTGGGGGGMGGDPVIRTLDGECYTVPDYLREFVYVETPETLITCKTRELTGADYPEGMWDHNGQERVSLGPFRKECCPHTYIDTLDIINKVDGISMTIAMDQLDQAPGNPPTHRLPMCTPSRNYPSLDTTIQRVYQTRDMAISLWTDLTLLERHNVQIEISDRVPRQRISGAVVRQPTLRLDPSEPIMEGAPKSVPTTEGNVVLRINGIDVEYSITPDIGSSPGVEGLEHLLRDYVQHTGFRTSIIGKC